jgi:hypothetical protein
MDRMVNSIYSTSERIYKGTMTSGRRFPKRARDRIFDLAMAKKYIEAKIRLG